MRGAEKDAPRTTLGTVPGTVLGVSLVRVCRWTSLAIPRLVSAARRNATFRSNRGGTSRTFVGWSRTGTCHLILKAIVSMVVRATREMVRRAVCRATSAASCGASLTASCESLAKHGDSPSEQLIEFAAVQSAFSPVGLGAGQSPFSTPEMWTSQGRSLY